MLQKQHVYAWLASAVKCDISCQQKGETAARQSRRALVYHRTKVIRYMKHWAGRYSSAGVGLERGADPRLWRCIPPSETDPAPGSAAASGGSAPGRRTSARTDHTAASAWANIRGGEVHANVARLYLLVPLYLCDQQEFVEQEQVDVDQLCVLWEWTDTNNGVRLFQTFKSQSLSNVWQLRRPRAPVSTSFPSCSRLLWEIRFSRVTAFKRCFRVCKTVNIESTLVVMC